MRKHIKRLIAFFAVLALTVGLLPAAAFAAGEATEITSFDQITDLSGNYLLTQDTAVTSPISGTFTGTFDGGGHTVTVNITATASNAGMFSIIGSGATVKNFKIKDSSLVSVSYDLCGLVAGTNKGTISDVVVENSTVNGYTTVGGLVGKNDSGTITKCAFESGTVSKVSTNDTGFGGLVGENSGTISLCSNGAKLDHSSARRNYDYTAGIAGKNNYGATITDCYNTGELYDGTTNYSYYLAGITSTSSGSVTNCHNYGTFTTTASRCYGVASSSTNSYYLSGCGATTGGTAKTAEEFLSLAATLGETNWVDGSDGYPVLEWQTWKYSNTAIKYTMEYYTEGLGGTYTLAQTAEVKSEPDLEVTAEPIVIDGFTFDADNTDNVLTGTASEELVLKLYYTRNSYTLTWDAGEGTIIWEEVRHNLTLTVTPEDATVVVKNSSGVEQSATDGVYDLREGTYTYTVSKYGYETVEETITLTQDETLTIDLVKLPSNAVSFEITKPEDTGDVVITVTAKDGTVITAAEDGTYDLIAGDYSYLITANGCNKVAADFTVTDSELNFTIALTIRTAWDGQTQTEPHTITAEEAVEDYAGMEGWYLITNGDELAWFANKVNTTSSGCTSSAVLAKDIDLGNEKWSPMGYNYSYYFAGTFDGMGHAIRGLYCDGTDNQGLFGYSKGTIRNLTVYGEVNGKGTYTGGIAAYQNGGSLNNCGSYVSVSSNYNGGEVGGIAGYAYGASFTDCFNAGTLTGSKQQGGIAGVSYGTCTFTNCYNVGTMVEGENVTESSSSYAYSAGILGYTNDYATVTVENCYNAGNVDSGYTRIGALVGQAGKSTTIRNSYYLNNVNKVCASYYSNEVPADISATACAAEEFKAVDMLNNLGSAYKADGTLDCAINDGYPVLSWQVIPVHTHTLTETPAEAATCTTEGNIAYWICSVCEKIFSDAEGTNEITLADTVLPLTGHSYTYVDNGDGTHTATCSVCNDTVIADHTFVDGTCICGATEPVEDPYLVPELKFFNVSLNIQSYIGIDYTLYVSGKNSVVKNYDSFYTVFNIGGEEQTLYLADMNALTSTLYYYEITATASQMTENITATLYAVKDGVTYHGETVNYTIREGVMSNIAAYRAKETLTAKDIAGYTFAVDMLKYGANAQVRFNNLPDDLADSLLTEADLAYATSTVPALTETASYSGTADPVTYQRLTLSLGSRIEIQGMIKYNGASIDDLEVHVSYGGKDIVMPVTAYSKSYGLFNFNELPITDVRTEVTIVIYNKTTGTNASQVWTGSIAALAAELIAADPGNTEVLDMTVREAEGRFYATITVRDNEYVAAVVLTDAKYDKEFTVTGVGELEAGKTTVLEDIDITGYGETIGVVVHDYAGNTKTYYLRAKGNTDDYAEVEVTDDMVLYSENFDNAWLPAGWSVESKSGAPKTWYRDEYNMAAIDPDEVYNQNEWLFTPSYDLSGQSTPTHMVFDFETSYTFCVQYPHFNVNVCASKDNGATWESIWNLHDSGLYSDWTRTQAKVVIPDDYQGCNNVRFAFVYTGDTGGAQFAFDNMRIYKDRAEDYIAVTASAGENGTISPEGRTLVRKGTSKTFTAIPNEGYEVAGMVVDGTDLGAIGYYTFETVGVDHTIEVSFRPSSAQSSYTVKAEATEGGTVTPSGTISVGAGESKAFDFKADEGYQLVAVRVNGRKVTATESYTLENIDQNYYLLAKFEKIPETPEVLFEQDFEDTTFPPEGWSILGGSETWRRYSYYYLNKTQNAYISAGEAAQDERLVSPSVDLTGAEDTNLEFDYAYPYYGLKRNEFTFTLEASTDAGTTWTTIWDAKDTLEDSLSGYVVTDRAFVTLPTELCVSNVIFAWRYTRAAGDNYGIAAIDNIKLEATGVNTDIAGQAKITATAGEGGIITPGGRVYVTEGEDQTFTITPVVGFAIEDVLVDGVSVGAVDSYTFTNVTGTHTISASFKVSSDTPGVIFENDFEDSTFPSRGWSVKSLGSGSNTWEQGTFSYVSGTKVALVLNEYEDWSNAPKQNELLISPTVDLTGIEPTLEFDYAFGRYDLFNGTISLTLEASLDGGETWTKIWDASTLENNGYLYQSGHAEVEIPAFYCKDGVSFAFRYTKQNGYEGEKAGIDNVKLVDRSALCEHPTTEIRNARTATCTEDGYAGDTYCTVCNALLAAGQVIPATGHTMMPTVANAPTCTENGNIAYWTCSVCNKIFSDETGEKEITLADTVIAASGHTAVVDPAVPATCTENGKTEGSHCTVCNTVLVAQETIPAAGHKPVADSAVPATCTENGKTEGSHCSVCNEILVAQETIPAAGHKLTATAEKAPTCTESGNTAYWTCSVCKKSFSDAEGTHEIALSNTVIAATGHSFGEWAVVEYPTCTANGKQERVCTVCGAKEDQLLLATDCPSEKMTDVPKNAWYHDAVDYMMARGLMGGDSATTFSPEGTLTRAQLVTVLYRIAGSPTVNGKHQFTDVPTNQWYSDAICWAAQNGVVNGVTPTTFVPQAPITREQIATILYRYAKSEPVKENKLIAFPDADKVNEYAVEAMNWAVAEGLIAGSEGMLLPQDSATRAQIATVLMRWLERE